MFEMALASCSKAAVRIIYEKNPGALRHRGLRASNRFAGYGFMSSKNFFTPLNQCSFFGE